MIGYLARRVLLGLAIIAVVSLTVFVLTNVAVDPATGLVNKSVVIDSEDNVNVYAFSNVKTNTGIKDDRFHFEMPKNAHIKNF